MQLQLVVFLWLSINHSNAHFRFFLMGKQSRKAKKAKPTTKSNISTATSKRRSKLDSLWKHLADDIERTGGRGQFYSNRYGVKVWFDQLVKNDKVKRQLYAPDPSQRERVLRKLNTWKQLTEEEYSEEVLEHYFITPHQFRSKKGESNLSFQGTKDWESHSADSDQSIPTSPTSFNSEISPLTLIMGDAPAKKKTPPPEKVPDDINIIVGAVHGLQLGDEQKKKGLGKSAKPGYVKVKLPDGKIVEARKCDVSKGKKSSETLTFSLFATTRSRAC